MNCKKIIAGLISVLCVVGISGCGNTEESSVTMETILTETNATEKETVEATSLTTEHKETKNVGEVMTAEEKIEKETTIVTKEATTEEISTEETSLPIVGTAIIDISPEDFVSIIKEAIQDDVGEDEYISDVTLKNNDLIVYVNLSNVDIKFPLEDLAIARAGDITDTILDFDQYDDLWNEITIDFGYIGKVKKSKSDIVENPYGRYFKIAEEGLTS